jgi:hypothetical protein
MSYLLNVVVLVSFDVLTETVTGLLDRKDIKDPYLK